MERENEVDALEHTTIIKVIVLLFTMTCRKLTACIQAAGVILHSVEY